MLLYDSLAILGDRVIAFWPPPPPPPKSDRSEWEWCGQDSDSLYMPPQNEKKSTQLNLHHLLIA